MQINNQFKSPNFYPAHMRKDTSILVIHATAADTWSSTKNWFLNPRSKASSHYVIDKNGDIYQMVDEANPAWHAGFSKWDGKENISLHSIGIEIVNNSLKEYPPEQVEAVAKISKDIMQRHNIKPSNLVRHSDIAGYRGKRDPYSHFPWESFKNNVLVALSADKPVAVTSANVPNSFLVSPWAKEAWSFAEQIGIVGPESDPKAMVTKEEVVTMLYRLYDKTINN